ncbi:MAG TPA: hypothetical protein VK959_06195 [Methylophilaceae bacterium]|jgi:hypothetical protein|nr:hypothetical protein [Methylophilaceae bacterium]
MKKPSLLACLALLVFTRPAWTEPVNLSPNPSKSANEEQAEDRQVLEEKLPPEARKRLREVLDSYSRQAYPDGEQLAERRRLMHDRMQERLNNADKNGVGSISRSEAQLRMPRLARQFDQIDTNGDNIVTREEMQAARDRAVMEKRETARADNPGADSRATKSQ